MAKKKAKQIVVIGCGSIGKRHIRNLLKIDLVDISAFDVDPSRLSEAKKLGSIKLYNSFKEVLSKRFEAALICTPNSLHIKYAIPLALKGIHLFIEKPISNNIKGIEKLLKISKRKKVSILVGCNMRFHPSILKFKELLDKKAIGKVLSARISVGQYLPDWHPFEDYRKGYSARKNLGGGILLDAIHEIDFVCWFMGDAKHVYCYSCKLSELDIDTEDIAELILRFENGSVASVHLDYLQRVSSRECVLFGSEGTLRWDLSSDTVKLFSIKNNKWQKFINPIKDINEMYIREMKHFLRCIDGKDKPLLDGKKALEDLKIILAAKKSASLEKALKI